MNTAINKKFIKCESTCVTCLKSTNVLYPISTELKMEYIKFVEMVKEESDIMICNMCRCQLRRCIMFKQQCQNARIMLSDAAQDLTSLYPQKLSHCLNLQMSKIVIHSIETKNKKTHSKSKLGSQRNKKCNALENQDKTEIINSSPNNIEPQNDLLKTDSVNISSVSQFENTPVKNRFENDLNDQKLDGSEVTDDFDSMELNNDYDDVPLLLLKESKNKKRKKKEAVDENTAISNEADQVVSSKIAKKQIKEGFSSRMVQETEEYVVIKLTKEQVLKEMEERSKTEMYLQSPFKCDKCVKAFNFQDVLAKHMEKHTKEIGAFQCEMCSQYCRSAVSLRGHIKSHTTRYRCKLCGEVRLSRQHLLEHHATHTRQFRQYACNTCEYTTSKRTVMQRHVRSHSRREPHACERCGKLFQTVESLRVHTARHDKSSRLQCVQCPLSFVYRSLLARHVARAHHNNEYYCVECDLRFKSSESLRLHFKKAKKHRDSSSYKHLCPQCPSRFFSQSSLSAHASAAHGCARALSCSLCARRYSGPDALRAHAWRTHQRQLKA